MIFFSTNDWKTRCTEVHVAAARSERAPWVPVAVNASSLPVQRMHLLSGELVRWAAESTVAQAHAFLCVYESGIFPSADQRVLYQCLRARCGNFDSIEASPGHEFLGHERAELAAVIECAMMNAWGITMEFESALRAVAIDHDGGVHMWSAREEVESDAAQIARRVRGERAV